MFSQESTSVAEKVLVIVLGEVCRAIFDLPKESGKFEVYGLGLDRTKMKDLKQTSIPDEIAVMHICLPCKDQDKFVDVVAGCAIRFKPALMIINSTVPPGTTMSIHDRCNRLVADSPFRGVHENPEHMKWELKRWTKYVGERPLKLAKQPPGTSKNSV